MVFSVEQRLQDRVLSDNLAGKVNHAKKNSVRFGTLIFGGSGLQVPIIFCTFAGEFVNRALVNRKSYIRKS